MKRLMIFAAAAALCVPLQAGMTYEFRSVTEGAGGSKLVGKAAIDGNRMRMEIIEGDNLIFKNDSVVISRDGGATLQLLDTKEKTYTEMRVDEIFGALGAAMKSMGGMVKMTVNNPTVNVREAGDGGTIEGYPTRKYLVDSSYELAIRVMGMSRKSQVESQTEAWVTDKIKPEFGTFIQQRGWKTGMEDFDKLIDQQASAMKGFPLKQIVRTKTTSGRNTESTTTTMTVTNIRETAVADSQFQIPAGYEKVETPSMNPFGQ